MPQWSDYEGARAPAGEKVHRAVLRYTWLLAAAFLVGVPGAYIAWTNVAVRYTPEGALWIENASPRMQTSVIAVRGAPRPESKAWVELLFSNSVLEPVIANQQLYASAQDLSEHLEARLDRGGNILSVRLTDADGQEATDVLNAVMERYVEFSVELKRSRLDATTTSLEEQLQKVELELAQAERDLEEFRGNTITLPSTRSSRSTPRSTFPPTPTMRSSPGSNPMSPGSARSRP